MYINIAAGTKVFIILHKVFYSWIFPSGKEWHNYHAFGKDIGSMGVYIVQQYTQPSVPKYRSRMLQCTKKIIWWPPHNIRRPPLDLSGSRHLISGGCQMNLGHLCKCAYAFAQGYSSGLLHIHLKSGIDPLDHPYRSTSYSLIFMIRNFNYKTNRGRNFSG